MPALAAFASASVTFFASCKLPIRDYLVHGAKGHSIMRGGRTLPFVFKSKHASIVTIARIVQSGSTVHADEAGHWDALHARFLTKRISEAYSDGEGCTNQAESFFLSPALR